MSTKQEIVSALRKRAHRCELIADLYRGDGDRLAQLQFLLESIACTEAAKAVASVSEYTAPRLMQLFENARAQGRADARRKQPRPRRATPQFWRRFAQSVTARLRAEQLPQAANQ